VRLAGSLIHKSLVPCGFLKSRQAHCSCCCSSSRDLKSRASATPARRRAPQARPPPFYYLVATGATWRARARSGANRRGGCGRFH
jgi:hypothetical protein